MRDVRFLVVDDAAMARRLVCNVIRSKLGSERILQAKDGKEAVLLLDSNPVDLIISDWNMGTMRGDELLSYVRKHQRFKQIPFLMVTSNNQREQILNAIQLGVSQYLVKPFTPAELELKIRNCWNAASRRQAERYADLPAHRVSVKVGNDVISGKLLNLSTTGGLLRIQACPRLGLYEKLELSLTFAEPDTQRSWQIPHLRGTSVRLEADESGGTTFLLAVSFDGTSLDPATAEIFSSLMTWLAGRAPN